MFNGAANLCSERGLDLAATDALSDLGDIVLADTREGVMALAVAVADIVGRGYRPIVLGGDHSVTYPLVAGVNEHWGKIDILHFDAHGDIYPNFDDNPYSHASPFARIVERGLVGRLVQVGVRTLTQEQRDMIERYGVETHEWRKRPLEDINLRFERPLYISLDIDALDPAFAPGVSHHEPGGMSCNDILGMLARVDANVVGADIVEYNPSRDWQDMTAMVCVKFVKELVALLAGASSRLST